MEKCLVYIAGYGRSGSSFFEYNFAKKFNATMLGERVQEYVKLDDLKNEISKEFLKDEIVLKTNIVFTDSSKMNGIATLKYFFFMRSKFSKVYIVLPIRSPIEIYKSRLKRENRLDAEGRIVKKKYIFARLLVGLNISYLLSVFICPFVDGFKVVLFEKMGEVELDFGVRGNGFKDLSIGMNRGIEVDKTFKKNGEYRLNIFNLFFPIYFILRLVAR